MKRTDVKPIILGSDPVHSSTICKHNYVKIHYETHDRKKIDVMQQQT